MTVYMYRLTLGSLLFAWTTTVWAATQLDATIIDLPWVQLLWGIAISLIGGMARTAQVIEYAAENGKTLNLRLRFAVDIVTSVVCGMAAGFLSLMNTLSVPTTGLLLLVAGYLGATFLNMVAKSRIGPLFKLPDDGMRDKDDGSTL